MHRYVWIGLILLVLWALLWLVFKVVSGIVHVLVFAAVIFIVWGWIKRGVNAVKRDR